MLSLCLRPSITLPALGGFWGRWRDGHAPPFSTSGAGLFSAPYFGGGKLLKTAETPGGGVCTGAARALPPWHEAVARAAGAGGPRCSRYFIRAPLRRSFRGSLRGAGCLRHGGTGRGAAAPGERFPRGGAVGAAPSSAWGGGRGSVLSGPRRAEVRGGLGSRRCPGALYEGDSAPDAGRCLQRERSWGGSPARRASEQRPSRSPSPPLHR